MDVVKDLDTFLSICAVKGVFTRESHARMAACVRAATANGFAESRLDELDSLIERKFVLRRQIPFEQVGSYAATFKTLLSDYRHWRSDPAGFLASAARGRSPRRFRRASAA